MDNRKKTLLGETGPNVKLNGPPVRPDRPNRDGADLGIGILNGPEAYIPYCLRGQTYRGKIVNVDEGPFNNGVFHSSDSGKTWRMETISDFNFGILDMCKTMGHYYFFATRNPIIEHGLWVSRKPISGDTWEPSEGIGRTFANVDGRFAVAGEGDTAHICWMDRRHNKWRFNIDAPPIENNEIFYRRRKDADQDWSKEVLLSKGLLYAYAPTISAEGDKVVVTWAGIQTASKQHTDMGPNDIYYVTSKDGGKTWTPPITVTDGAKAGMTAGMPQVALLNGTIHLLYIQGKLEKRGQVSPGLTKINRGPWPIYYTQRPFPE